jgi:hypothetical protein
MFSVASQPPDKGVNIQKEITIGNDLRDENSLNQNL